MESPNKRQYIVLLIHVLVWVLLGFVLMVYPTQSMGVEPPVEFWIVQGMHLVLLVIFFYGNSLLAVPRYLLKHRPIRFSVVVSLSILFIIGVNIFLERMFDIRLLLNQRFRLVPPHGNAVNVYILTSSLLVLGISTSVAVIQQWYKDNQARQQLEQTQTVSELALLKSQINPHFFFNTLNNIYSLTFIDLIKSRESLHKLSRMMRYLLYEAHDTVLLSREIDFVQDYVSLMRIRLQEGTKVLVDTPEILGECRIYPMLLIPFVENAFKHGVSGTECSSISIRSSLIEKTFRFEVENSIVSRNGLSGDQDGGIGLANTRRRLDLLYKGMYCLNIEGDGGTTYFVSLVINL